jgi:hypothetical protein
VVILADVATHVLRGLCVATIVLVVACYLLLHVYRIRGEADSGSFSMCTTG